MTVLLFSCILLIVAFSAGILGALTGLGGGVVLIPVLVLLLHVNMHYAMGASLIAVIATSSGTSIAYLREGYTNLRIAMFLELGAAFFAVIGALLVTKFPTAVLAILFGCVLIYSSYLTWKRDESKPIAEDSHAWAKKLNLNGSYPTKEGIKSYQVYNVPFAFSIMSIAGILAGLLGIGSGTLKVLAMDQAMKIPYKVATATSNFIIGITAAVSSSIYFANGYINPSLIFPVVIGVVLGAFTGGKLLTRIHTRLLRIIFSVVVFAMAIQLIYKGFAGAI